MEACHECSCWPQSQPGEPATAIVGLAAFRIGARTVAESGAFASWRLPRAGLCQDFRRREPFYADVTRGKAVHIIPPPDIAGKRRRRLESHVESNRGGGATSH